MPHLAVARGRIVRRIRDGAARPLHPAVDFSPWYLYPRVAVMELTKTDCSAHGSTWNSTLLDQVVSDFM